MLKRLIITIIGVLAISLFAYSTSPIIKNHDLKVENYVKGDTVTTITYNDEFVKIEQPISNITVILNTNMINHNLYLTKHDNTKRIYISLKDSTSNNKIGIEFSKNTHDIKLYN